jgi:hypothetical protein
MATAAMASSSMPMACSGLPDCTALNVYSIPPTDAQKPLITYTLTLTRGTGSPISIAEASLPPMA